MHQTPRNMLRDPTTFPVAWKTCPRPDIFPLGSTAGCSRPPSCITGFPSLELPPRVFPLPRRPHPVSHAQDWLGKAIFKLFQLLVKSVHSQLCYIVNTASRIVSVAETDSDQGTTPTPLLKTKEVRPTPRDRRESYNVITRLHGIFMAKRTFSSFERLGFSLLLNTSTLDPIGKNRAEALKNQSAVKKQES